MKFCGKPELQVYEPNELKRCGPNEYCTRTHDSLKISHEKWCWNSRGIGGRTALDYLIKVEGVDFVRAVETLCGYCAPPPQKPPPEKAAKPFAVLETSLCPAAAVAYLQKRGIDSEIIQHCLQAQILSESRKYQNCVFIGRDPSGRARFAALRGTRDNFKLDVEGSDKRFSFFLPAANPDCPRLAVAESPIDALSVTTLAGRISLIHPNPPPVQWGKDYKDYNELLCAQVREEQAQRRNLCTER